MVLGGMHWKFGLLAPLSTTSRLLLKESEPVKRSDSPISGVTKRYEKDVPHLAQLSLHLPPIQHLFDCSRDFASLPGTAA